MRPTKLGIILENKVPPNLLIIMIFTHKIDFENSDFKKLKHLAICQFTKYYHYFGVFPLLCFAQIVSQNSAGAYAEFETLPCQLRIVKNKRVESRYSVVIDL